MKWTSRKFLIPVTLVVTLLVAAMVSNTGKRYTPLESEIGRLLFVGLNGRNFTTVKRLAQEGDIGGVVIYGTAFKNPDDLRKKIAEIRSVAKFPLLVAVDVEGGRTSHLEPEKGFPETPSATKMGTQGDEATSSAATVIARTLKDMDIDWNFAPVVDLGVNPSNPAVGINERTFSADPQVVVARARRFIAAHEAQGVQTALKHFPGHGSSSADSHFGWTDVTSTWREEELTPFRELIHDGYRGAVMVGHLFNAHMDPQNPASLSPATIAKLLRQDLGFQGLVISDDLQMHALSDKFPEPGLATRALQAGNDVLIFAEQHGHDNVAAIHEALVGRLRSGELTEEQLEQSLQRLERFKPR